MSVNEMAGWFPGPKAENAEPERAMLSRILENYFSFRRASYPDDPPFIPAGTSGAADFHQRLNVQLDGMIEALHGQFPSFSPRYMAHMISDQTLPSVLGYFAGLLYNPNNVTPESSSITLKWELEVGADILRMLGYTAPPLNGQLSKQEFGWAHITSGGTVANLEALWLARNVRYFPLAVRDVCERHGISTSIKILGVMRSVTALSPEACLGCAPCDSIELYARLVEAVREQWSLAHSKATRVTHELLSGSKYSIAHHGTSAAYGVRPPVVLVSGARHYSITKAADLLGIGRSGIELVDVDEHFRMDVRCLDDRLKRITTAGLLPVAVIAIAGTTEEGAVDPIDRVAALRDRMEMGGESFWLHIDAAWGGYVRALFTPEASPRRIREFVSRDVEIGNNGAIHLDWGSPGVCAAFDAFPRAESITVDPHKLGYVPYPCGVIAYRDDLVRQFVIEEIPYISDVHFEDVDARQHRPPSTVGPYILEGSKPGSAVTACWLSHRMIPLNWEGHGQILRASLLAARELYERLVRFGSALPFRIVPITTGPPDTNVVCFFVKATANPDLAHTNALNRAIYQAFSGNGPETPPFFLSRTVFERSSYSSAGISALLDRAGIDAADYRLHGLFVLRATIMSPYQVMSSEAGCGAPLFAEFMDRLHRQVLKILGMAPPEAAAEVGEELVVL